MLIALNSNVSKSQIAAGFAWGVLLGLIPAGNFFWIVLLLVSFFFRHNLISKLLPMVILILLSPLFAMRIDAVGWYVLHIGVFQSFFTKLYNMPFVPFTKFNNTLVMGGLVSGIILWLPVFFLFMALIPLYRNHLEAKIINLKLFKKLSGSRSSQNEQAGTADE